MKIIRKTEVHGSVLPPGLSAIAGIPGEYLHHEIHGLRHPLSSYGTSIRLITAAWIKVFDDLTTLRTRYFASQEDNLPLDMVASYAALLHKFNEHFDACYTVLRSLSDKTDGRQTHVHSQYLDKIKFVGWRQFKDATRNYRESHVGLIVNSLKHSQGELCPMYFHTSTEFRPGYYLRGLLPGSVLGPDQRLHQGANAAISFSRDMLIHLWWLYRTSELLATAIAAHLDATYKHQLVPKAYSLAEANWPDVVNRCASIRPEFFPDEWDLPYPRVIYMAKPEQLTIEFPSTAGTHKLTGDVQVRVLTTIDCSHPTEKLPYFGASVSPNNSSISLRS